MPKSKPLKIQIAERALLRLVELRREALASETRHAALISKASAGYRESARNLIHYLALRSSDIRELQTDLARLGLSSLGRMEAHVLSTMDQVIDLLHMLTGLPNRPIPCGTSIDLDKGKQLIENHALSLLGAPAAEHAARIMVTVPKEAAEDPNLIQDLLKRGMQVMRINCAHDGPLTWARIIRKLRHAERRLGKSCKISFDLAGPKLRTGPVEQLPGVFKWKPHRDRYGRLTTPAVVNFVSEKIPQDQIGTSIPVHDDLVRVAHVGDRIELVDTRGRHRDLKVAEINENGFTCFAEKTGYVTTGIKLHLCRNKRPIAEGKIVCLPPDSQKIPLRVGDQLRVISTMRCGRNHHFNCDSSIMEPAEIGCTLPEIFDHVKAGERILFDDGRISGVIKQVEKMQILVEITSVAGGLAKLGAEKGINLPDTDLPLPALTAKDMQDLDFVARHADMVALSFVQSPIDVSLLMDELRHRSADSIGIVLKIETQRAFAALPSLLLAVMQHSSAAVMVARGDLGVEVGFERLSEVQEEMLWLCEAAHVPVIWATQVLESLAKQGLSSRAEVTDAAMASRAECVMLNKGPFILDAVSFLRDVLHRMQAHQSKKTATFRRLGISDTDLEKMDQLVPQRHGDFIPS